MKNKKKISVLAVVAISSFALGTLSACDLSQFLPSITPKPEEKGFTWSVTEDQEREIGSVYNMANLWGRYDGEYFQPTVEVTYNGEAVEFDANNYVLPLYELGDYTITLTFKYTNDKDKEVTTKKTYVVTSVDTTAPVIAKLKAERLFSGAEIDLTDTFTAYDSVDGNDVTLNYSVKSPSGEDVTVTDGVFTANDFGYYTVSVTSSDTRNNTATKDFNIFIRNSKIFEAFRLEDESEQKGYSVNGRDFAITTKNAQGDGGCLYYMSYLAYNHAFIKFENSLGINWSKTNGLLFTVYNASKSAVTLEFGGMLEHEDIWGSNRVLYTLQPEQYNTVFVSADELVKITESGTEYLYVEMCYSNNGAEFKTGQFELYFDDVVYASKEEADAFAFAMDGKNIGPTNYAIPKTTIENANGETVDALHYKPAGTWERFYFTYSGAIKWSNIKTLTIDVYNPMNVAVGFRFGADKSTWQATGTGMGSWGTQLVTLQPGWNKVTIDVSSFSDGDVLYVAVATKEASFGNTAENYDNYVTQGIYFAGFEASYYSWTEVPEDPNETGKDNVIDDNY